MMFKDSIQAKGLLEYCITDHKETEQAMKAHCAVQHVYCQLIIAQPASMLRRVRQGWRIVCPCWID